jgi:DNA gyrase subunit B
MTTSSTERKGSGKTAKAAPAPTQKAVKTAPSKGASARVAAGQVGSSYSASDLQVLEGLDAVRKRPGMYIGSTDSRGMTHLAFEIIDNAVDEALAGYCSTIEVVLHEDGSVSVTDDGRGIPVDVNPQTKLTGVELVFTKLHAGGKFGGGGYKVAGGLHGVGASVVNALSERLEVEVLRGQKLYSMSFQRGTPGVFSQKGFKPQNTLRAAPAPASYAAKFLTGGPRSVKSGTKVRYWPDREIFPSDATLAQDVLRDRLQTTAFLVPGLTIRFFVEDLKNITSEPVVFFSKRGTPDLVETSAPAQLLHTPIHITGTGSFLERVPVLKENVLHNEEVSRDVEVDISLAWCAGFEPSVRSFVNIVSTAKGGTHVAGFERGVVKVLQELASQGRTLRANEDAPEKVDVLEGLVVAISVKFPEPQYEGQTKEVLGTAAITKVVEKVVLDGMRAAFEARGGKTLSKVIVEKVVSAARTRRQLRAQRDVIRRKNALESSALPAKLVDCRSSDNLLTELLIVEGDSAMGTGKSARDAEFQALLPIRGKILNTLRTSEQKMLDNAECASIVAALGAGCGRSFDVDQVRYGKLIVLADADVDGAHIRCLLLAMTWRYMRPLLEAGRVYAAVPPLHRVALSSPDEYVYTYSDPELKELLAQAEASNRRVREVQRYKGLGEMDAEQLFETTLDPARRVLRRITIEDATLADETFELLMGNDVAPRRDFIVDASDGFDLASLDV